MREIRTTGLTSGRENGPNPFPPLVNAKRSSDDVTPTSYDAIDALLVLVQLLEREADQIGQRAGSCHA
jgi:hypothetical protein